MKESQSYRQSGESITQLLNALKVQTRKSISAWTDELGTRLNVSSSTIRAWQNGRSRPKERGAIKQLARLGIEQGKLNERWLIKFLRALSLDNNEIDEIAEQTIPLSSNFQISSNTAIRLVEMGLEHGLNEAWFEEITKLLNLTFLEKSALFDKYFSEEKALQSQIIQLGIAKLDESLYQNNLRDIAQKMVLNTEIDTGLRIAILDKLIEHRLVDTESLAPMVKSLIKTTAIMHI